MDTGLNIVIDGQWGSTGKGKLAAYLALKHDVDIAICNNASNAGHSFFVDGKKYIAYHLPAAAANPRTRLLIGPAAMITLPMFLAELEDFRALGVVNRLFIHPQAVIITEECKAWEKEHLTRISSTTKGCGRALAMKVMRHPDVVLAGDVPELREFIHKTMLVELYGEITAGKCVLAETAQGFDLSLNHGMLYPYCTSRDVTTAQTLNDCGIPPHMIGHVYGSMRCHPIRVGNVISEDGHKMLGFSGPSYFDQREMSWAEITAISGSKTEILERTTVTNKIRRVFSWSHEQARRFVRVCSPDFLFLNFVNYLSADVLGMSTGQIMDNKNVADFVTEVISSTGVPVAYLGTGPDEHDMVDLMKDEVIQQ